MSTLSSAHFILQLFKRTLVDLASDRPCSLDTASSHPLAFTPFCQAAAATLPSEDCRAHCPLALALLPPTFPPPPPKWRPTVRRPSDNSRYHLLLSSSFESASQYTEPPPPLSATPLYGQKAPLSLSSRLSPSPNLEGRKEGRKGHVERAGEARLKAVPLSAIVLSHARSRSPSLPIRTRFSLLLSGLWKQAASALPPLR